MRSISEWSLCHARATRRLQEDLASDEDFLGDDSGLLLYLAIRPKDGVGKTEKKSSAGTRFNRVTWFELCIDNLIPDQENIDSLTKPEMSKNTFRLELNIFN